MSKVDDMFRELQLKTLEDMKKTKHELDVGIANLEYAMEHPTDLTNVDFSTLPKPEPDCYICVHATAIGTCRKGHEYGHACGEYKHFAEEVEDAKGTE